MTLHVILLQVNKKVVKDVSRPVLTLLLVTTALCCEGRTCLVLVDTQIQSALLLSWYPTV